MYLLITNATKMDNKRPCSLARGDAAGGAYLRRGPPGVVRPRRQRDTTSRYTATMLRHLENKFRDDGVT